MKHFLPFLAIFLLLLSFSGGSKKSEADSRYLVSALGIDFQDKKAQISIETLITGSEGNSEQKVFSATGPTPKKALENLKRSLAKPLSFEHCGVVVLDGHFSSEKLPAALKFCKGLKALNLSAHIIKTENAKKLVSCKPISTTSVGYDIMGILEINRKNEKSRFYEIKTDLLENKKPTLPEFKVTKDKFFLNPEGN